jgi:hypothetical protein
MSEAQNRPSGLLDRFRHWRRKRRIMAEFANLDAATRGEILHELNLDPSDFKRLAEGAHDVSGLSEMLARLRLDEAALTQADPDLIGALKRNCAMCVDWRQCHHEIEDGSAAYPAPHYCPNRDVLTDLAPKKN